MTAINRLLRILVERGESEEGLLREVLYDLCDELHACDYEQCPVVRACEAEGGRLHKNGSAMLDALKEMAK